jgi:type VI protein secretion system component VasF
MIASGLQAKAKSNPAAANMQMPMQTPLSPKAEAREKDRVTLLLDINRELLMEVMALQTAQAEQNKEAVADGETKPAEQKPADPKAKQEFFE